MSVGTAAGAALNVGAVAGTVCVYGLWHLGCVTAACLAGAGMRVVGLDPDAGCVADLAAGWPPISEPGLTELVQQGLADGTLAFTADPAVALAEASIVWVTFDTPVDEDDRADVDWVRAQLEAVRPHLRPGTLILLSSQVPVGFSTQLERDWRQTDPSLQFACTPENLRLGRAIEVFHQPERVVLGTGTGVDRERLASLFAPFLTQGDSGQGSAGQIEWMSLASAEMTKHALNGFLAVSVAYTNELARLCERVGADATEVERGLRSEPRIGRRAYVSPGPPIAGGTLLRDIGFLAGLSAEHGLANPLIGAVRESNEHHQEWAADRAAELLAGVEQPRAAVLGLTYKPGTDTLRRSSSLGLAARLAERGIRVAAYDPAIRALPPTVTGIDLAPSLDDALAGADVAILATPWPEFRELTGERLARQMRRACIIDQAGFLPHLAGNPRLIYVRVGQPLKTAE